MVNQPSPDGGWVATHEDITERTHAARELNQTRTFLDTIIENVPTPIVVKEVPSARYILLNRAAEVYYGVKRSEMLGKTTRDVMPPSSIASIEAEDRRILRIAGSKERRHHLR